MNKIKNWITTTKMHYPIYKSTQKNVIVNSQINSNLQIYIIFGNVKKTGINSIIYWWIITWTK